MMNHFQVLCKKFFLFSKLFYVHAYLSSAVDEKELFSFFLSFSFEEK